MAQDVEVAAEPLWKQRFRANGVWYFQIAAGRGIIVSTRSGSPQIYAWDIETGETRQLTDRPGGLYEGLLSPDGRHVYYVRDEAGNERGHYVQVPWEGGPERDLTPNMPDYAALYRAAVSGDGSIFAFTPTEENGFPLYTLRLKGGAEAPRELYRSAKLTDDVALSAGSELAVVATSERSEARQYVLLAFDVTSGQPVAELSDLPEGSVRAVAFSPIAGDLRLLCTTDRSGFTRPLIWNPRTGERRDLELNTLDGDIEGLDWSPDGHQILLRQIHRAAQRLFIYDLGSETLTRVEHPDGTYELASFLPDGRIVALRADSTHLPEAVAIDPQTGHLQTLFAAGESPSARPTRSVSFPSIDGEEIQAWLGLPDGEAPFKTILTVHGGPHMASSAFLDPFMQAWLDRGFAVLDVNYRGSTTFGKDFKEKIWGDLGHWEVEDMVAARDWLIREGIARPDQILVTGASYGGYLTLMALGTCPDLWAGGMALVAPADFANEFAEGTDWSRGYLTAMLGGTPETKPEQYRKSSPITYAEQVRVPLQVIQGKNDLRCPPRQMELYAERMQALGKPFEIHWFDAGHGAMGNDELIGFQEMMMGFAERIVGGPASNH